MSEWDILGILGITRRIFPYHRCEISRLECQGQRELDADGDGGTIDDFTSFGNVEGVEILAKLPALTDKSDSCVRYVDTVLGIPGLKEAITDPGNWFEQLERLGFRASDVPRERGLVLYGSHCELKGLAHVGIWSGGAVVSKWAAGHIYKHALNAVPSDYGNTILFMHRD
ncbi:MAG: hypothetical protein OXR66_04625 [Candidatus Woesearchaeota archaeon]|nr:hypothetical protein [Candidatus Woesearchaeota archaeon]